MTRRVLHVLSQRPSLTGSGITLDSMVRHAARAGWEQRVVVGVPVEDSSPKVGDLAPSHILPLVFGSGRLAFPVPGMSDVMPYRSTVFSKMTGEQLETYRAAWLDHLSPIIDDFQPDIIHSHHIWILSSLLRDLVPHTPVITQCHATGFRQMELCPGQASVVRSGCRRNTAFVVLHQGHKDQLCRSLEVAPDAVHIVGAGYRDEIFTAEGRERDIEPALLYVGKYSASKGLPQLLEAFERLVVERPSLVLHVAGSGAGAEAEGLRERMRSMPGVRLHGQLDQPQLAELARTARVAVLPSFYEGVPLVLVETLACGCRLVATDLPGVVAQLAPHLGEALRLVATPPLIGVDTPEPAALPAFVDSLVETVSDSLDQPPLGDPMLTMPKALHAFTWGAVFDRVEKIWKEHL